MGDRKARLAALAAKAGRTKEVETDDAQHNEDDNEEVVTGSQAKSISFRNYAPADESLANSRNSDDAAAKESATKKPKLADPAKTSSSVLEEALSEARQELVSTTNGNSTSAGNIDQSAAPRKINWDLKRDIQGKMNKLEKRTQKAIVQMLKERLEKEAAEQADSEESELD